ncbi:Nodule Cysteine-Rich (NCR) secreted peptide [Medicago truncatula]|uniref:Nodule Cysteine-Rich (NCR) secreted peptide n=1 Tax=Medicago truncatula TaxID=3880 RepID=A0A072TFT6_MEDTR|nr:Nodule Cysteine-Rich (NCR) secreted peptide [Medicago truncatula]
MAKVTKFVYITIHVLSLFFITMNDSDCVSKIICVLSQKPLCRNHICVCYKLNR